MSDQEREVWKETYKIYDKYYDREMVPGLLPRIAEELREAYVRTGKHELMIHLGVALINYFGDMAKETVRKEDDEARQLQMEGV